MQPSPEKWARVRAEAARVFPAPELALTAVYILLAAVWSVASGMWVDWATGDADEALALQSCVKGVNFVLTSSCLLYLLMRRLYARRRAAEQLVADQAERFELVARASTDVLWDMDVDGETIWWSEGYSRLFGRAPEGPRPSLQAWYERLHPGDRGRVQEAVRAALDQGRNAWSHEYRLRKPDGAYATVLDRATVVRDAAGKPVRVAGGITDQTERLEAARQLRRSRERLRALAARLQSLREEERTRLAREIHDELGQLLTALRLNLRWVEDQVDTGLPPESGKGVLDRVVECTQLTDQVLGAVRRIASELRPSILDSLGLLQALRREGARFERQVGATCHLTLPDELPPLSSTFRTEVFRIFQEALTNVARHARASEVRVLLTVAHGRLSLAVRDNGRGLQGREVSDPHSLGLLGMRERATTLRGTLTFREGECGGTSVELEVPLPCEDPPTALSSAISRAPDAP